MVFLYIHGFGRPADAPLGLASVGAARPSLELSPGVGCWVRVGPGTLRAPVVEPDPGNETVTEGQGHPGAERQGQSCVSCPSAGDGGLSDGQAGARGFVSVAFVTRLSLR